MRVKVYRINAEQALAQKVKHKAEGIVIAWNTNGTAIVQLEDLTLECIDVARLQGVPAPELLGAPTPTVEPTIVKPVIDTSKTTGVDKTPAITAKATGNKK
jgi:hypothetical protein